MSGESESTAAASAGGERHGALARIRALIRRGERWLFGEKHALYGLAAARILLGLSMLGLLLSNFRTRFYTFGSGSAWNGEMRTPDSEFPRIWLFSLFRSVAADDARFTACYLLLIVLVLLFTVGWRFRIVLPLVFVGWVGLIELNEMVGDQSDNMQRIALILFFFADPAARWSIDARRRARSGEWFADGSSPRYLGIAFHNLAIIALVAQLAFVYAAGGLYKAAGEPWSGGWAVYDPLQTARFGSWPWLSDVLTAWGPLVAAATWGSLLLQVAFPLMLLTRPTRVVAVIGILGFHLAIGVLMGLPWFSLTMIALDAVLVSDRTWSRASRRARLALLRFRRRRRRLGAEGIARRTGDRPSDGPGSVIRSV